MAWLGVAVAVLACVPDLAGLAGGSEVAHAVCFSLMAMVAPALLSLGASAWFRSHWLLPAPPAREAPPRRHRVALNATLLVVDVFVIVAWRTPLLVDALARHRALVLVESATLVAAGVGIWLQLVDGPTEDKATRPRRGTLAALVMWTVWTLAYLEGMSTAGWYHSFHHVAGSGLSAVADRELSALVLWATAALAFMPVVFWNLSQWLRAEGAAPPISLEGSGRPLDPLASG